jgi:hypothetical protein
MVAPTTTGRTGRKGGDRKSKSARAGSLEYIFLANYFDFSKVYFFRYHVFIVILKNRHQKVV